MIETRKEMQITVQEVNRQRNNILDWPQLDMIKQLGSIWVFGIFSSCHPVLSCVEKGSTRKDPELQENLIRGCQNVMLAPPYSPLMLNTDDNTSAPPREMEAFSYKTNVKNRENDWPNLEERLNETKPETSQVMQLPPEPETPEQYNLGQWHLYKMETIPSKPFQTLSGFSDTMFAKPTRMRWTPELHDHFVEAVNQLGGIEKATPNGILNLMKVEGLTLDHVENHLQEFLSQLQKYSTTRGRHESSQVEEGFDIPSSQTEETTSLRAINDGGDIDVNEALKIQMEVQKQLHEHLEMQRKLQMRLQEQGKHLKRMIEQQQHTTVDQSHASSLLSLSSNNYDGCTKDRANQTKYYDKHDTLLQY